jgi:hypothetical protein
VSGFLGAAGRDVGLGAESVDLVAQLWNTLFALQPGF